MTDAPPPPPLIFDRPALLLGGGPAPSGLIAALAPLCGAVIAADGGANRLRDAGPAPDAVIGDMDSLEDPDHWRARLGDRLIPVAEQDSTDLEKCLRLTRAPLYLGVGFLGGRIDHSLAALHTLLVHPERRILLAGREDLAFLAPLRWRARLETGARVSIYPLADCVGLASTGLEWPLESLPLGPGTRIGTSNRASAAEVGLDLSARGALIVVERRFLREILASLDEAA
ncbi:MAG: thiamine diphosphokinase [Rhodobacteraceae bacterium]|nr:thiamine diphosphokinase [Paracoccaceae bacterium]MBR26743.1 thiamine diphosphokinase [Paracoccaceae bacterium]